MPRNQTFASTREPFRNHDSLHIQHNHTTGPLPFLNPTRARFTHHHHLSRKPHSDISTPPPSLPPNHAQSPSPTNNDAPTSTFHWRSRDNRKGRHTLFTSSSSSTTPTPTSSLRSTLHITHLMLTHFPYWNISYLVAIVFTLGSLIWCLNGFFAFLPLANPQSEFEGEVLYGGGITAFIGATIFELGSVLLMLEAVNENQEGCFGWVVERVVREGRERWRWRRGGGGCRRCRKGKRVGKLDGAGEELGVDEKVGEGEVELWQWWPSIHDLRTHYVHELGFLACAAQLFGASVFWISGFTALPGVIDKLSQGLLDGIYWTPQIVGGTGFIVSSILVMLETQRKWYEPAFGMLGWHIGFWNLVGAVGFTLCGALGPAYDSNAAQYQASLATFWGSWAFLIGSLVQWYECLDTHPVEKNSD